MTTTGEPFMNDRLNALEREIVQAETSAEGKRWAQAEEVVRRLDAGETQREVAASWINARTGMPYDVMHVCRFAQAWRGFVGAPLQDRPPFWEAFDSQRPTTRTERVEAQAPRSEKTARKLVENILSDKTPAPVRREIVKSLMQDPEVRIHAEAESEVAREENGMRQKARAQEHARRERLGWMDIEVEFDKVSRALRNALLLVRECELDNEARDLLTERAHELQSVLGALTVALAGGSTVDWDAELAKLDPKGGAS